MRSVVFKLMIAVSALVMSLNSQAGLIVSDFTDGNDGWRLAGSATTSGARWSSSGYIFGDDTARGGLWYFSAPAKFLGNLSGAFGNTFDFSTTWSSSGSTLGASTLLFIYGNGQSITWGPARHLENSWTDYSIRLDDSVDWNFSGGGIATNENIQSVLSDVTTIYVRGEWGYGGDRGFLDNVSVFSVPEPAGVALLGFAGMFLFLRKKKQKA